MTEDTASKTKAAKAEAKNPEITLPISKVKVEMKIATGKDESDANAKFPIKPGDTESFIRNRRALMCTCITKIDGKEGPISFDVLERLSLRDRAKLELMFNAMNDATDVDDTDIKKVLNPFFGS